MGALHAGHMSLAQRSKGDCDITVVSLFVNPTQFAPSEDLSKYPRDLNRDMQITSNAEVDALFMPDVEEIYPTGFQTWVEVTEVSKPLEGEHRPTHYRGVATVVTKLLNIVQPDIAYFGQKDYQQFLVVERMVKDLNIPTTIQMVPTVRESDGLAMSSRNQYLSPEERNAATLLSRLLRFASERVLHGEREPVALLKSLQEIVADEPLAQLDYISLVHPDTLLPVTELQGEPTLLVLAIRIGKTRLIDNGLLLPEGISLPRPRISKPI